MNCTQVEKFLALYAGHDLSGRREQAIATHLQTCTACAGAVADYREARELVRGLTPPAVSDDVYSEIRNSVWRLIEGESKPSLFQSLAVWFRPRFVWTAAVAALLITVSVAGVYFVAKRSSTRPETIADKPKEVIQPENRPDERQASGPSNHNETPQPRQANMAKRPRKLDRTVAPDRADSIVAYSPDAQGSKTEFSSPIIGKDKLDMAGRDAEKTLRLELQTKNPNIRIIWFTQREAKPVVGHSKGI